MATIPEQFTVDPESAIASFAFTDIATGLGFVAFLGIASEDSGGIDFHLITNALFAQPSGTRRSTQGTTTLDFDTAAFNLPRTAKGTAYFSAGMAVSANQSVKLLVQVKHVSNSTVTNITSEITSQTFTPSTNTSQMVFLELPIKKQHYKKGDFIRLTVKLNQVNEAGDSDVGHDPKNQTFQTIDPGTKDTTIMTLLMPFVIDI